MRLSEAIRLGAMMRPQGYEEYFIADESGVLTSCALGAAYEATYGATDPPDGEELLTAYPVLRNRVAAQCPVCEVTRKRCETVVTHLNDVHRWTREQIAAWVESVERQHGEEPAARLVAEAVVA